MTIFYRSRELVIDNEEIVELLSTQRFALAELHRVQVTQRDDDQPTRLATPALATAVAIAATGTVVGSPAAWIACTLAVVLLLGAGGLTRLFRRPRLQLHAVYRGADVCLFSTTDAQTFGQVRRGLVRALEANNRR